MIGKVAMRYAYRSLFRHARRTLLSVFGVGVGCAIGLIATAFYAGSAEMQIRAVSESGGGHLRVVPKDWTESRRSSLRIVDSEAAIDSIRALPGTRHAVPRSRTARELRAVLMDSTVFSPPREIGRAHV